MDPFTLFGLFNRGIKDSNRQAIAAALAQFLGVEEAVPESFEGIPVLNNQKSWFFPYAKDRDPAQIDALWHVFQSGLAQAEADTEQAVETFSRDWFAEVVATELRPLLQESCFDAPDVAEREADRSLEGW